MQKFLFLLYAFIFFCHICTAQESDTSEVIVERESLWSLEGSTNLKLAQSAMRNWISGGDDFMAINGILDLTGGYDDTIRHRWMNQFRLEYGITRLGGDKNYVMKNIDLLRISSIYSRTLTKRLSLSASVLFSSQIAQGFKYVENKTDSTFDINLVFLTRFMSPGFLEPSLGFTYLPVGQSAKDKNAWAIMLFPISGKFTYALDERSAKWRSITENGQGKDYVRAEVGSRISTNFNKEIMDNLTLNTNLMAFANFQKFTNVDITFNMLINMRVNKYIGSSLSVDLLYDDDTIGKIQFRNLLNVGLSMKI